MASQELQGPYLAREALRLIRASPRLPSAPQESRGGLQGHYFHVDTAPVDVSLLS